MKQMRCPQCDGIRDNHRSWCSNPPMMMLEPVKPMKKTEKYPEHCPTISDETEQTALVVCNCRSYEVPMDVAVEIMELRRLVTMLKVDLETTAHTLNHARMAIEKL